MNLNKYDIKCCPCHRSIINGERQQWYYPGLAEKGNIFNQLIPANSGRLGRFTGEKDEVIEMHVFPHNLQIYS